MILNCMEDEIVSRTGSALFGPIGPEEWRTGPYPERRPRTLGIGWLLYAFVRAAVPDTIVEIGTGGSSACLLWGLRHNGTGHLYTCDVFASGETDKYHRPNDYLKELDGSPMNHNKALFLRTLNAWQMEDLCTVVHKSNAEYLQDWVGDYDCLPIDMLVVDDDHSTKSAKIAVEFMKLLSPAGYAFFHDYTVCYHEVGAPIRRFMEQSTEWSMIVEPNMLSMAIIQRKYSLDPKYAHYAWRISQTDNPRAAKAWGNMNNPRAWEIMNAWNGEMFPENTEEYNRFHKEGVKIAEEQMRREAKNGKD